MRENKGKSYKWVLRKIFRLVPLYYISIFVTLLTIGGARYWLGSNEKVSVINIIFHLLLLHGFNPYYFNSILGVEWYLGTLCILYLFSPLIYRYVNNLRKACACFCVCSILCPYLCDLVNKMCPILDKYVWDFYIINCSIIAQLPLVFLGIILFFVLNEDGQKRWKMSKFSSFITLLMSIYLIRCLLINNIVGFSTFALWGIAFIGIIISQCKHPIPIIQNRFFVILGKYSYGMYLFHYLIIKKIPYVSFSNDYFSWILNYIIVVIVTLVISILLTKYFEEPITKLFIKLKAELTI